MMRAPTKRDYDDLQRRVRRVANPPAPRVVVHPPIDGEERVQHASWHRTRRVGPFTICTELGCPKLVV